MPLIDDLTNKVNSFFNQPYEVQETTIVPGTDYSKLTFGNNGLTCEFAFLFVDIRKSSKLHEVYGLKNAAKIYQSFHEICVRIIISNDGSVRAFDGDRVMGVFAGETKNSNSVKAAMQIQWAIRHIVNVKLTTPIRCGIGVDYGKTLVTKVGKGRDMHNQDLIWVGQASNYASHLCNAADNTIIISERTFGRLLEDRKISNGNSMWSLKTLTLKSGQSVKCYESRYEWKIP